MPCTKHAAQHGAQEPSFFVTPKGVGPRRYSVSKYKDSHAAPSRRDTLRRTKGLPENRFNYRLWIAYK